MASSVLIQTAYAYIRKQITTGEFMPGTLLSENELSETLGMSRTPIRAAIAQLEHEGLVATLKNRGLLVKELSIKEAMDILELLHVFQTYALEQMESSGELPDMKKLKGYLDNQYEATGQLDYSRYVENAFGFMQSFVSITNNHAMQLILKGYVDKLRHYSYINYKITPHEPHFSANIINQAVYDAMSLRDFASVRAALNAFREKSRERLLRVGSL
ncbi:GntR family transcriptional regulator [Cohnella sp. GCM10027633]|uniref:GntR family transcriptional regulator n=1 Tax=unclassified Cohnella TaxID=2636738 RepID=UPI0036298D38